MGLPDLLKLIVAVFWKNAYFWVHLIHGVEIFEFTGTCSHRNKVFVSKQESKYETVPTVTILGVSEAVSTLKFPFRVLILVLPEYSFLSQLGHRY